MRNDALSRKIIFILQSLFQLPVQLKYLRKLNPEEKIILIESGSLVLPVDGDHI